MEKHLLVIKKNCLLFLVAFLWSYTPLKAQIRGNNIVIMVTPDHRDWNYKIGEKAIFSVKVLRSGTPLNQVQVDYEAGPVFYPDIKKSAILKNGEMQWSGKMDHPGFYRLKVTASINGKKYEGLCTAGFSPEKIVPFAQCPEDFDEYWSEALKKARKYDLNPTLKLLPDRCTDLDQVYEVSFVNDGPDSRIYGILSVPIRPGKYPALLRVPGAGCRPYGGDTYTADGKCIVLEIGIHGIPVTMPQIVYDRLLGGALNHYWDVNIGYPDKNYFHRVVIGAVRAVDYLASRPEWDEKTLGVTGASQGGFLSLATAALDSRVTFLAAVHDAMCDYEAELHGVAGGWPHYFYHQKNVDEKEIEGARYYDGVNFACRVTVPCWFSFGYNDETVPPTSSYGTYNIVKAPKRLSVYQMTGHYWYQEQWDEWQDFLRTQLHVK
ncbi:MAG: acetylxylan esterase [Prevotella sp.]|jgi:cephalosporin-C deacetylase-like acetyl esterase|nr:acetylxylan esterase [Prevotella sp.]MCH4212886.1 acetylxylan esterase [Prevotella sp.]MCH4241054.1 acetylxylan esterase [Prevotella sp.]